MATREYAPAFPTIEGFELIEEVQLTQWGQADFDGNPHEDWLPVQRPLAKVFNAKIIDKKVSTIWVQHEQWYLPIEVVEEMLGFDDSEITQIETKYENHAYVSQYFIGETE